MIFVEMIELEQHLSGIFKQTLNSIEMIRSVLLTWKRRKKVRILKTSFTQKNAFQTFNGGNYILVANW